MNLFTDPLSRVAIRVLAAAAVAVMIAVLTGHLLAHALLPLWTLELPWFFSTHWRVDRLYLDHENADHVIRVLIGLRGCMFIAAQAVCESGESLGNASTLVSNVAMPTALMLAFVLGWPVTRRHEWWTRALCLMPALGLMWACDVPLTLASAFWSSWGDVTLEHPPVLLIAWTTFLQSGGRIALGLVLAAGVIGAGAGAAQRLLLRSPDGGAI